MQEDIDEKAARRQVKQLRHFYRHALIYAVVIAFLHIINLITDGAYWAFWPALGWGLALAIHGITTLELIPGYGHVFGPEWEEKKVQQILARRSKLQ